MSNPSENVSSLATTLTIRTTLKDADSNEYRIAVIGDQVWTEEKSCRSRNNCGLAVYSF